MRVDGESSRARKDGLWHSVRWSKPGDVGRSLDQLAGPVPGGQHHGRGTVGDGRDIVATEGLADVLLGQEGLDLALAPGADRHLGHRALVGDTRGDHRPGLEGGEGERVGTQGSQKVRVHLHRVDQGRITGGRAARTGDHGDLDVALLQPQPGLVQGPGPVHLHVAVPLRGPGADGVQVGHEREGLAGDVVAAAEAGEVDVGPGEPERGDGVGDGLHQQLGLGLVGVADHRGLGPADDGDVGGGCAHQKILFTRSGSSRSGSPLGIQPSSDPQLPPMPPPSSVSSAGEAHTASTRWPTRIWSAGSSMTAV